MIKHEYVLVNGDSKKPGYKLSEGDKIKIERPEIDATYAGEIEDVFEDELVTVVNKPAGMLTHSKGPFNPEFTVADHIVERTSIEQQDEDENGRLGIVHRLDRYTSGILITAKTSETLRHLQTQFADRKVHKFYIAVVDGTPDDSQFMIDVPISRDPINPKQMHPDINGKPSTTGVSIIQSAKGKSLLLLHPLTGRTHQLRVHLSHIGHPIAGDEIYGGSSAKSNGLAKGRFLLHAYLLIIRTTPGAEFSHFVAKPPEDMSSYISDEDIQAITKQIKQQST